LDRIFTMFVRLHSRDTYPGTGVGLAICRGIVERHEGYIHAASKPGEGATFTVGFPVK
jgi:signal transduction histidine kinase